MKIGTDQHKRRFCEEFIASHDPYDPRGLPWPELDDQALERLRAIPFWPEVLHTERRAGAIVEAYGATIGDPLVRRAVMLQGFEEARHARLLRLMIERYGIAAEEGPLEKPSSNLYRAFTDFGYGECLDAFLGFGVFKIARRAGYLPDPMFAIFETLLHEENRHIVFFVNWMAWEQARRGRGVSWLRSAVALRYYLRAIGRLLGTVRRGQKANDGKDFSATQASVFIDGFSLSSLVEECCTEHARRMRTFDPDLLQPRFLPRLAAIMLAGLRLGAGSRRSQ
ncbi:MAG TPA: ferritin-like domain-containing protein [Stellaceae bacterium]|jgi:hypothetical protein|nr:ferritin-like domain-containing protein [Stellaceae bacterium]